MVLHCSINIVPRCCILSLRYDDSFQQCKMNLSIREEVLAYDIVLKCNSHAVNDIIGRLGVADGCWEACVT